jgi:prefoldin beta subunit
MSAGQMPPWLQEQLMKMQQSQQNLQSIMTQKQPLEMEKVETEKALEELKKAADDDNVYKHAGSILIKSTKKELIDELEERKEMAKTRSTVLEKQELRIKESLKEQEAKITEMMRGPSAGNTQPPKPSSGSTQIPKPQPDDNPRK